MNISTDIEEVTQALEELKERAKQVNIPTSERYYTNVSIKRRRNNNYIAELKVVLIVSSD